jgi:hypothetical protein
VYKQIGVGLINVWLMGRATRRCRYGGLGRGGGRVCAVAPGWPASADVGSGGHHGPRPQQHAAVPRTRVACSGPVCAAKRGRTGGGQVVGALGRGASASRTPTRNALLCQLARLALTLDAGVEARLLALVGTTEPHPSTSRTTELVGAALYTALAEALHAHFAVRCASLAAAITARPAAPALLLLLTGVVESLLGHRKRQRERSVFLWAPLHACLTTNHTHMRRPSQTHTHTHTHRYILSRCVPVSPS